MKSSTQVFAALVAGFATLGQSAIATPVQNATQNSIDSYRLSGKGFSLPSKIELQPRSLIAQDSDICKDKKGTFPVRINAPDNVTPAYSGNLQPGVNAGTRCIFFKDVSTSVRFTNGKSKVWLVIHGWLNNSDSNEIKALALEVARQNPGDRVLMLDWGEAARNSGNTQIPKVGDTGSLGVYYAANWIRPIAEAVVDKLKSDYGLTEQDANQNLNIIGHSLGTLMASEIGAIYSGMNPKGERDNSGSPINSIIALDPPSEASTTLNLGGYDVDGRTPAYTFKGKNRFGASQRDAHPEAIDRPKKFSDVSRFSRAFVGAKSLAGNQEFASWAHESFQMDFGNKTDLGDEHGRVVQAFTTLISQHPFKQPSSKNSFLDLNDMRAHNNCAAKGSSYFMKCNTVDGKHEGTVEVNSSNIPTLVKFTRPSGETQQIAATNGKPIATNPTDRSLLGIEYVKKTKKEIRDRLEIWDAEGCQGLCQLSRSFSICKSVKDIDQKTNGLITGRVQKTNYEPLQIGSEDLKLMKLISSQCEPFTDEIPPALSANIKKKEEAFAPSCQSLRTIRQKLGLERLGGKHYKSDCLNSASKPIVTKPNTRINSSIPKPSTSTSDDKDRCLIPTLPGIDISNVKIVKNISSRDEKVEQYIRKEYADALNYKKSISYAYNKVDLDVDGKPEVLLRVVSSFCGSGGCPVDILKLNGGKYSGVNLSGLSWGQYIVTSNKTNGFKDMFYPHFIRNEKMYFLLKSSKLGGYQKVKEYTRDLKIQGTAYLVCGKYLSFSQ